MHNADQDALLSASANVDVHDRNSRKDIAYIWGMLRNDYNNNREAL